VWVSCRKNASGERNIFAPPKAHEGWTRYAHSQRFPTAWVCRVGINMCPAFVFNFPRSLNVDAPLFACPSLN
jgi:hypothetical protein